MRTNLTAVSVFCLASSTLFAEEGLRFTLSVEKTSYLSREPVVVEYAVVNESHSLVSIPALIDHAWDWVRFEIAGPEGKFQPYRTGPFGCPGMESTTLEVGARLVGQMTILTNAYGRAAAMNTEYRGIPVFPFTSPGTYQIRAVFPLERARGSVQRRELRSNILRLVVRDVAEVPPGALSFFQSDDEFAALLGGDSGSTAIDTSRSEEFRRKVLSSVYTPFVQLVLAEAYRTGAAPTVKDLTRAADLFNAVVASGPRILVDNALMGLAKCRIERGEFEEARVAVLRILDKQAANDSVNDAKRIRNGLAAGYRTLREMYSH